MSSESASLSDILSQLETKNAPESDRKDAYSKFSRHFTDDEVSLFSLDVAKNVNHVIEVILQDVMGGSADVSQGALQVLGVCLHDQDIVRNITPSTVSEVVKKLCQCIHKTEDKTTCTRALWCLGKQNMTPVVIQNQVETVLTAVDFAMEKWTGNSITVEHECVNTIARLSEQAPKEMTPHSARWGKVLLPLVAHTAIKVRERVLAVIESTLEILLTNQKELTTSIIPVFKSKVCSELKTLLASKHEIYVLKCWGILVQIFGDELHRGTFINSMLPIIELGFKGLAAETKIASFMAWQHLIDNFATNPNILSDPKRLKLLMQVFKMNNAKVEEVARVKFNVWWHLIWLLGNKISSNFDLVAAPMLQFCVGGSKLTGDHNINTTPRIMQNGVSPVTPRMNLTCPNSQWTVFKFLQLKGCEVLAHFLGSRPQDIELPNCQFTLDALRCEVITGPTMFIKNSSLFITSATELFISLGKDVPESLLLHIWYSLVAHLKNGIEGVAKLDMRDTVIMLLKQFQVVVLSRVLSSSVILKMLEGVCCLPKKVLCSSAYNIGGDEMIHGTPALFLMELLLTPALLQSCPEVERYHTLYSLVIDNGLYNSTGSLGFLQAVVQVLDRNATFVESAEMLWRFWSAVVHKLQDHITKTNEINQGDSLEHNFSCVNQALLFPIKHKLPASVPQPTLKTLTKTWTELYKTVNRLAAMVTNAEANIVCEDVCHGIMELNKEHENLEPLMLEFEVSISHVIITSLDFSSLGTQSTFGLSASPAKWNKKRHRTLENIHSLVMLLSNLQNSLTQLVSDVDASAKSFQKTSTDKISLQGMLNTMVDSFSVLFTHVSSSAIISAIIGYLAQPIGELFQDVAKKTSAKVYNNAFQQKIEKLWMDITTCLQSRYQSVFDSHFLQKLSPLLEATFLHSRRQVKNQTTALWNVTFGKAANLDYPEALKPVLSKVKEKSVISLPGWVSIAVPVIEETPISQMSQSQAPEPHIPGMPSPHKIHGSFLNKAVSPNVKKSPAKLMPSPKAVSAKKKVLGFDSLDDKDFVVIRSSPRKPRLLTDHQKEVLKERKILPAMYNNLELSQDVSMMANFHTDTQDGSQSQTPTPTLDKPFSLFGSAIPSSLTSDKQEKKDKTNKSPEVKDIVCKRSKRGPRAPETASDGLTATGSSQPTPTRRRSVRFKDEALKQSSTVLTEAVNMSKNKAEKESNNVEPSFKNTDNDKISLDDSECNDVNLMETSADEIEHRQSIVEIESSGNVENSPEKSEELKEVKALENNVLLESKEKSSTDSRSEVSNENEKESSSENEKGVTLSCQSIPQNVLGAIGPTPESSSKNSESKSMPLNETEKTDLTKDQEDESQLLFSWTQKLNELNKSPRSQSPLKKIMLQDGKNSSQRTRSQSPAKSPKRSKKKVGNENFGNLDKWIIRSPTKSITDIQGEKNNENIMTVGSTTFVEETQSPTKFVKDKIEGDNKTDSIMETPPKHDFSNSSIGNFGNSNRKLFQGSQENIENIHDILEDSNIIAASPNSKSSTCAKTGTPVLKLTRLTDSEIKKYSPVRDGKKELDLTPTKSEAAMSKLGRTTAVKNVFVTEEEPLIDQSTKKTHMHDDFSAFQPIETGNKCNSETDGFSSKTLTDTDQALLKICENDTHSEKMDISQSESQSDSDLIEGSQSLTESSNDEIKGLFSQIVKEAKLEVEQLGNESFEASADIFSQEFKVTDHRSQDSQDETHSFATLESQKENEDVLGKEAVTPRGRKRKQETPKKTTPEDIKRGRKKKSDESSQPLEFGSAKKVSKRLQEKRDKKELEKQGNSPTDAKKSASQESAKEENAKEEVKIPSQEMKRTEPNKNHSLSPKNESIVESIVEHWEDESQAEQKPAADKSKNQSAGKRKTLKSKSESIIDSVNKPDMNDSAKKEEVTSTNVKDKEMFEIENGKVKEKEESISIVAKMSDGDENNTANHKKKDTKALKKKLSSSQEEKLQKTPESRHSSEQPERKSTTKKKKAVAQKRVLRRAKDIVVNESDSNLDQDFSDDDVPLSVHVTKTPVAENLEKKIDEQLGENKTVVKIRSQDSDEAKSVMVDKGIDMKKQDNEENKGTDDNDIETEADKDIEAMDISFGSDDIPLSSLKSSQENQNLMNKFNTATDSDAETSLSKNKTKSKGFDQKYKKSEPKKDETQKAYRTQKESSISPVSNKLRSCSVKTRLRSGEKKAATSPRRKKLSLAARHVTNAKKKLNIGVKKKDKVAIDLEEIEKDSMTDTAFEESEKNAVSVKESDIVKDVTVDAEESNDTKSSVNQSKKLEVGPSQIKGFAGMKDESTSTSSMMSRPANPVFDILDETPTKGKESPKRLATALLMRNSDSKLIVGSRKFEKRPGFARRSILKPSSLGSSKEVNSPKRDFHPIKVARIYSPTASPSASILKKRRLSEDSSTETNSPPAKQRRVSFAEPLTESQVQPAAVVVLQATSSTATEMSQAEKNIPTGQTIDSLPQVTTSTSETQSTQATPTPNTCQSTQATPTPNTYQSTQESQLDDSQPVFPGLIECDLSVEKVLPQLTSSIWSRGLGQLVRARNIHTIGHLSALTEAEIDSLPIKAPKVQTVRKVLSSFGDTLQAKKSKMWKSPKAKINILEEQPASTDVITVKETSEAKEGAVTLDVNEGLNQLTTDIDKILASSGDLVDEVQRLSQKFDQSQAGKESGDMTKDQSGTAQQSCDLQCTQSKYADIETNSTEEVGYPLPTNPLLNSLSDIVSKSCPNEVQKLRTDELFQAQQFINDLQNKVLNEIRTRCHSPTS